jgi:hypothetical protein
MLERAVRDHVHALDRDAQLAGQPPCTMVGVHDDRIEALIQSPLRGALARPRLTRQQIVRGQHQRPSPRQQHPVHVLEREPLEVDHVRRARRRQ